MKPVKTTIADDTKRSRESLYKSLSQAGNPSFETIIKVLSALGFGLRPVSMPAVAQQ